MLKLYLDFSSKIRQSNITKELQKRFGEVTQGTTKGGIPLDGAGKRRFMHDFLIALVFVAMVAAPAVIAASPKTATEEDQ